MFLSDGNSLLRGAVLRTVFRIKFLCIYSATSELSKILSGILEYRNSQFPSLEKLEILYEEGSELFRPRTDTEDDPGDQDGDDPGDEDEDDLGDEDEAEDEEIQDHYKVHQELLGSLKEVGIEVICGYET